MINFLAYSQYMFGTPIKWYAFFVMLGAFTCYLFCKYFYQKDPDSKKYPSLMEDLLLVAFPSGIIGARIWFLISEWAYYKENLLSIFKIWEGGLAIQGGVMFGVLGALLYVKLRKIKFSKAKLFDMIVPNILIAQVIGRWGNFFNQEVYGACVNRDSLWFVPPYILNNMNGGDIYCAYGEVATPLFLYESVINLIGFIFISIILRKFLKNRKNGDLAAFYAIWYGTVRLIMEPLRNPEYIMTIFGDVSLTKITSILFISVGVVALILLRYIPYIKNKKKVEEGNGKQNL